MKHLYNRISSHFSFRASWIECIWLKNLHHDDVISLLGRQTRLLCLAFMGCGLPWKYLLPEKILFFFLHKESTQKTIFNHHWWNSLYIVLCLFMLFIVYSLLNRLKGVSISDICWSIEGLVSYNVGAWRIIPAVPTENRINY